MERYNNCSDAVAALYKYRCVAMRSLKHFPQIAIPNTLLEVSATLGTLFALLSPFTLGCSPCLLSLLLVPLAALASVS